MNFVRNSVEYLIKKIKTGQTGFNILDQHCREHDIAYDKYKEGSKRRKADEILARGAWERVKAKDSNFNEKLAALGVAGVMKAKAKLGFGVNNKKKKNSKDKMNHKSVLRKAVQSANKTKNKKFTTVENAIQLALKTAQAAIKKNNIGSNRKNNVKNSRVLPVPKIGSALPALLFPILSAIGALAGGAGTVANVIKNVKNSNKTLAETQRHNKAMEDIAKSKNTQGKGVYLKPYKHGSGIKKKKVQRKSKKNKKT